MRTVNRARARRLRRRERQTDRLRIDMPEREPGLGCLGLNPADECLGRLLFGDLLSRTSVEPSGPAVFDRTNPAPRLDVAWYEWGSPAMN
jgi:hypothetical protein